jgi:TIGR03009 family protein
MRPTILCLLAIAVGGATELSAAEPPTDRSETLLKATEKRMQGVDSFYAKCERTDIHPLTKKEVKLIGEIAWQRPNKAKLDLSLSDETDKPDAQKTRLERFISNGRKLYEYNAANKLIVVHEMPKDAEQNLLVSFMKGMKADELRKRFDIKYLEASEKRKDWYAVLRFDPMTPADKQDFQFIEVAVWLKNPNKEGEPDVAHVPWHIRYVQPNGGEVKCRFFSMRLNPKLDESAFAAVGIRGYALKRATQP